MAVFMGDEGVGIIDCLFVDIIINYPNMLIWQRRKTQNVATSMRDFSFAALLPLKINLLLV